MDKLSKKRERYMSVPKKRLKRWKANWATLLDLLSRGYQILRTWIIWNVWQTERRVSIEILGVKRSRFPMNYLHPGEGEVLLCTLRHFWKDKVPWQSVYWTLHQFVWIWILAGLFCYVYLNFVELFIFTCWIIYGALQRLVWTSGNIWLCSLIVLVRVVLKECHQ